jgi:hypothetical protein
MHASIVGELLTAPFVYFSFSGRCNSFVITVSHCQKYYCGNKPQDEDNNGFRIHDIKLFIQDGFSL